LVLSIVGKQFPLSTKEGELSSKTMIDYETIDSQELKKLKVKELRDISAFCDLINFRGGSQNFYALHREMAEINCKNQTMRDTKYEYRRKLFLIPREHFKSTVNTILYTLWRIYRNPDISIIIGCNVKELATDMIREIRQYLEDPELTEYVWNVRPHIQGNLIPRLRNAASNYKRLAGITEAEDTKVIWTAWALQVVRRLKDKQPTLQALSVGMSPTGKHCDLVIFDDIVNWDNSESLIKARRVQRWAHDIESVVTKRPQYVEISTGFSEWVGNEILINGTRYYSWDFYSKYVGNDDKSRESALRKTRYTVLEKDIYVNGKNKDDGYICPEIFGEEEEQNLLATGSVTKREWYAQFRNKIISEDHSPLHADSVKLIFPGNYRRTNEPGITNFVDTDKPIATGYEVFPIRLHLVVDLAISTSASADNRAIVVGGVDELRRLHIVDGQTGKWSIEIFYDLIHKMALKWNLNAVTYESGVGLQDAFYSGFHNWCLLHKKAVLAIRKSPINRRMSKTEKLVFVLSPIIDAGNLLVNSLTWQHSNLRNELDLFDIHSLHNDDNFLDCIEMIARTAPSLRREYRDDTQYGRNITINTMFGGCR